jgi:hypothetical protein
MRRFQRNRRQLLARPRRQPRQIFVPDMVWTTSTDTGILKVSEACTSIYDEDFQIYSDTGAPLFVCRVAAGQTTIPWTNFTLTRVTPGAPVDGGRIISSTTRGGIRGPDGMTLAPFGTRVTVAP